MMGHCLGFVCVRQLGGGGHQRMKAASSGGTPREFYLRRPTRHRSPAIWKSACRGDPPRGGSSARSAPQLVVPASEDPFEHVLVAGESSDRKQATQCSAAAA
jgi:hypothetical protein